MSEDTYGSSISDLRSELRLCKKYARNITSEYKGYSIFNFSGRKDALRRLKFYTVQIDSIYQTGNDCSEFYKEDFVPFMIDLLEYKEHDNYTFVDNIYDKITRRSYDIITTTTHANAIYESSSGFNMVDFCSNCNDNKFIILDHNDRHGLYHNLEFRDEYANYPYLANVGEDIINYRLRNRNASSKEVLNNVLNNLKKKNKQKKKLDQ